MDIHRGFGNANKIMNRLLFKSTEEFGLRVAQIDGGSLRNAIPRESFATIVLEKVRKKDFEDKISAWIQEIKSENSFIETKLEINRRRVHSRIGRLQKSVKKVSKQRAQQKARRNKKGLPVISIIGYTNAGKSTLLNTLTHSAVLAENRLFATLDPSSRRLRFPQDLEVIITDTVGFIHNLPKDLVVAFRATLEELESADLLLHVIDISNPRYKAQIDSVEQIIADLRLGNIPCVQVLNKMDRVRPEKLEIITGRLNGFAISALDRSSLKPLVQQIVKLISA